MEREQKVPSGGDYCVVLTSGEEVGGLDSFGVATWPAGSGELVAYDLWCDEARDTACDLARQAGTAAWDLTSKPYRSLALTVRVL